MRMMPPHIMLGRMMTSYAVAQLIRVAAELSLADLLKDGPLSISELARHTRTDEPSLYRILRGLVMIGVFKKSDAGAMS